MRRVALRACVIAVIVSNMPCALVGWGVGHCMAGTAQGCEGVLHNHGSYTAADERVLEHRIYITCILCHVISYDEVDGAEAVKRKHADSTGASMNRYAVKCSTGREMILSKLRTWLFPLMHSGT